MIFLETPDGVAIRGRPRAHHSAIGKFPIARVNDSHLLALGIRRRCYISLFMRVEVVGRRFQRQLNESNGINRQIAIFMLSRQVRDLRPGASCCATAPGARAAAFADGLHRNRPDRSGDVGDEKYRFPHASTLTLGQMLNRESRREPKRYPLGTLDFQPVNTNNTK